MTRSRPLVLVIDDDRDAREAVASVLDTGGTLLAEAGTGTGKTLAYLVPAILSGQRVLVSTGTKNLQEQIYFKDIPALREALGVEFTATYMKGRANYLCLHKLDQLNDGESVLTYPVDFTGSSQIIVVPAGTQPPEAGTIEPGGGDSGDVEVE